MMSQEDLEVYQVCDYLESYDQSEDEEENDDGRGNHLNAACRTSICEWMYRVVDHFGVDREGKCTSSSSLLCRDNSCANVIFSCID